VFLPGNLGLLPAPRHRRRVSPLHRCLRCLPTPIVYVFPRTLP